MADETLYTVALDIFDTIKQGKPIDFVPKFLVSPIKYVRPYIVPTVTDGEMVGLEWEITPRGKSLYKRLKKLKEND
jgi:hypothetical protein